MFEQKTWCSKWCSKMPFLATLWKYLEGHEKRRLYIQSTWLFHECVEALGSGFILITLCPEDQL